MLRANVLLIGPDDAVERVLDSLLPHCRQPVFRWTTPTPLALPPTGVAGTMIIENTGRLPLGDQRRLFDWLTTTGGTTQIVSTARTSLVPLIATAAFIDALYYRLNIICIDATAPSGDLEIALQPVSERGNAATIERLKTGHAR